MQLNKNLTPAQVLQLARYLYPDQSWVLLPESEEGIVDVKNRIHDDPESGNGIWYIQFVSHGNHLLGHSSGLYQIDFDFDEKATIDAFLKTI